MTDFPFKVGDKVATRAHGQTGFVLVTAVGEDQFLGRYCGNGGEASYTGICWYPYVEPAPKATVTLELEHREPRIGELFVQDSGNKLKPMEPTIRRRQAVEYLAANGKRWVVQNVRW